MSFELKPHRLLVICSLKLSWQFQWKIHRYYSMLYIMPGLINYLVFIYDILNKITVTMKCLGECHPYYSHQLFPPKYCKIAFPPPVSTAHTSSTSNYTCRFLRFVCFVHSHFFWADFYFWLSTFCFPEKSNPSIHDCFCRRILDGLDKREKKASSTICPLYFFTSKSLQ